MNQKLTPLVSSAKQQLLLQMIAWMLQHRLLLQLHTYVHFMPDYGMIRPTPPPGGEIVKLLSDIRHDDQKVILSVSAACNQEDLAMFCKFFKKGYLSGKNHLEDIMYFENLRRSQLVCLLDKFREVLVFCEMEDSAISMFYPHSQRCY